MSLTREGATFFSDDAADLVMDLAAKLDRREEVFLWWSTGRRREVWAKVTCAWKLGDGQPWWRRYGIMYDLGPRCQGWPRPDGSPSVRPFVHDRGEPDPEPIPITDDDTTGPDPGDVL